MAFTFARWLDPQVQFQTIQQTMTAAMLTVGFVKPEKDASKGELWECMKDLQLVTWRHQARDLVYLRRFALRSDSKNSLGVLWIGAQLNGENYRITFNLLPAAERERLARQLSFANMALGTSWGIDAYAYKARSIRRSDWAGRAPRAATSDDDGDNDAPARTIGGGGFYATVFTPTEVEAIDHREAVEEAAEETYFN